MGRNIGCVTVIREAVPDTIDTGDKRTVMSNRFLKWAEAWIEENIPPGGNPDLESFEARSKRMMKELLAEAAAANFNKLETEEERERIAPQILAAVSDSRDFDTDAYVLKTLLARENEDGD
jgi:hypothetical protein